MTTAPDQAVPASLNAAPPGGRVMLEARWSASQRSLRSLIPATRRPTADRLLVGKAPEAALKLVPLLYSLCGKAQAAVARAALGAAVTGTRYEADGAAVAREAIAEHLWRLLIDWPDNLQKNPDRAAFAAWHRALSAGDLPPGSQAALSDLAAGPLAEAVAAMAAMLRVEDAAAGYVGRAEVSAPPPGGGPAFLPAFDAGALAAAFGTADGAFARYPTWQGRPAETGALALADRPDPSLAGRLRARLADLQRRVAALEDPTPPVVGLPLPGGGGIAGCPTARGLLMHRAVVESGSIRSYVVVAPTEWNFHPDSAWAAALSGWRAETPEIAHNALRRWVLALDPCVPATIAITKED